MPSIGARHIRLGALAATAAAAIKFAHDNDDANLKQKLFTVKKIATHKIDAVKLQSAIQTATDAVNTYKVRIVE